MKKDLPPGPLTWEGDRFAKDADGNYRFVYSGEDAQAGQERQRDHPRDAARVPDRTSPSATGS